MDPRTEGLQTLIQQAMQQLQPDPFAGISRAGDAAFTTAAMGPKAPFAPTLAALDAKAANEKRAAVQGLTALLSQARSAEALKLQEDQMAFNRDMVERKFALDQEKFAYAKRPRGGGGGGVLAKGYAAINADLAAGRLTKEEADEAKAMMKGKAYGLGAGAAPPFKVPSGYYPTKKDGRWVVNPIPGGPVYYKEREKLNKTDDTIASAKEFKNLLDSLGTQRGVIPTEAQGRLRTAYGLLFTNLKEFMGLGVIAGPDMELVRGIVADPTSMLDYGKGIKYHRAKVNELIGVLQRARDNYKRRIYQSANPPPTTQGGGAKRRKPDYYMDSKGKKSANPPPTTQGGGAKRRKPDYYMDSEGKLR